MYYRNVKIIRDQMTQYTKLVPSHEVEVLRHVFDPESVIPQSGFVVTERPYPVMQDEYQRLINAYGSEAVRKAYPTQAHMEREIPLLARCATAVVSGFVGAKEALRGKVEHADIPTPESSGDFQRVDHRTGMREAIEKSLLGIPDHDAERGRFGNRE